MKSKQRMEVLSGAQASATVGGQPAGPPAARPVWAGESARAGRTRESALPPRPLRPYPPVSVTNPVMNTESERIPSAHPCGPAPYLQPVVTSGSGRSRAALDPRATKRVPPPKLLSRSGTVEGAERNTLPRPSRPVARSNSDSSPKKELAYLIVDLQKRGSPGESRTAALGN